MDRKSGDGGKRRATINISPAQRRSIEDPARMQVDHARNCDAYSLAVANFSRIREHLPDALAQLGYQLLWVSICWETYRAHKWFAEAIGHLNVGSSRADVHRHD